ncbi:hypothetical protein [Fodinicurvata sp. EGI_FJ10296]|uniref:N-acyl amino acid synthase FeeM domain-containing protein n=1 Tax=Fodinicurvata sp. EGI_FJ10296 TaxID=3231908 RepID=UPI0034565612
MSAQSEAVTDSPEETDLPLAASVNMMLASMVAIVLAFTLAIFTPPIFGLTACVAIYGLVVAQEIRNGVFAPTSITVLVVYAGFASLVWIGIDPDTWLHQLALVLFGALTIVTGTMLAFGKPFTMVYSRSSGMKSLHWFGSSFWVAAFALAAFTAYYFRPSVWFVLAPLIIIMMAVMSVIITNFFYFGPRHVRERRFQIGELTFEEMAPTEENLSRFFEIVAGEFWQVASKDKSNRAKGITKADLHEKFLIHDSEFRKYNTYFRAMNGEETVGVVCFHHDNKDVGLPVESGTKISFDALRRRGKVAEMDLIGVIEKYRMRNDAFVGLVKCGLDLAHDLGIDFLAIESFPTRQGLYKKVGFVNVTDEPRLSSVDQYGYILPMRPMVVNMGATLATAAEDRSLSTDALGESLNMYLAERAAKRMVLKHMFSFRKEPIWEMGPDELKNAVALTG